MLPHDWLAACSRLEIPAIPVLPPLRAWWRTRRLIGQFVVVKTARQSSVGVLTGVGLFRVSIVLAEGTLWTERWSDIASVRPTSCPAYLRVVQAAGRVA